MHKTILVFAAIVTLCGANVVSYAQTKPQAAAPKPPENVAQQCNAQCPRCGGGFSNGPGGPGVAPTQNGGVVSDPAACIKEHDNCINQCFNRVNSQRSNTGTEGRLSGGLPRA
jgi:hypothetical protein